MSKALDKSSKILAYFNNLLDNQAKRTTSRGKMNVSAQAHVSTSNILPSPFTPV